VTQPCGSLMRSPPRCRCAAARGGSGRRTIHFRR
jgi:hypothetical protein